ncbi:unnamed protein product [Kuraishia capsulata CBS 1993]|uniref:Uncharacterized protein n=1 Tax=Kuraishia capsulata CBS 1993 TaxID=1382522 RepID=W6MVK8_9ASCO|nr:uncharacterized protein KUCA_T00002337001 [Kuraishia capsulata CBS 1993]CDK26365.1 unnamed protein product [Kuraishia capsulata CBS 1993]
MDSKQPQYLPLANTVSKPFVIPNISPISPDFKPTEQSSVMSPVASLNTELPGLRRTSESSLEAFELH